MISPKRTFREVNRIQAARRGLARDCRLNGSDFRYCVFGLHLHANCLIPGLESAGTSPPPADVEIHLGLRPRTETESSGSAEISTYVSSTLLENGEPALQIWQIANGTLLRMEYFDGVQFWLDREGKTIWALWPNTLTIEDAATYLLGPVLGLLLRLRGVTCLHASAVTFDDSAVAFAGCEGAGKSTTAAALARRGHSVISDDIVAITERDGAFFVFPAYPYSLALARLSEHAVRSGQNSAPLFSQLGKNASSCSRRTAWSSRRIRCHSLRSFFWVKEAQMNWRPLWRNYHRGKGSSPWYQTPTQRTCWIRTCARGNFFRVAWPPGHNCACLAIAATYRQFSDRPPLRRNP